MMKLLVSLPPHSAVLIGKSLNPWRVLAGQTAANDTASTPNSNRFTTDKRTASDKAELLCFGRGRVPVPDGDTFGSAPPPKKRPMHLPSVLVVLGLAGSVLE